jgi:RNA polymerase sigma-70 factor (ECF subfamily)
MKSIVSTTTDPTVIKHWCERAAADRGCLEQLLWAYHARLLSFAQRKIGPEWRGRIEPEDVLQEAYIEVFATIGRFTHSEEDSFYHWVATVIHHRFIDHVRRWQTTKRGGQSQQVRRDGSGSRHDELLDRCLAKTPSRIARREEALAAMMTAMARLPHDYQIVVQRVYLNQEPVAAVAIQLGRSEKAVRHLASRAVLCLARDLGRASNFLSAGD